MAEFQWWLLLVGLVAGGGLVAVVTMNGRRREEDIVGLERRAETTWIVDRLADAGHATDPATVEAVLRLHREYLDLPPPDELLVEGEPAAPLEAVDLDRAVDAGDAVDPGVQVERPRSDGDPDRRADEVRDDGRRRADEDLARAREQQAAARQEAHAGADREQRADG